MNWSLKGWKDFGDRKKPDFKTETENTEKSRCHDLLCSIEEYFNDEQWDIATDNEVYI